MTQVPVLVRGKRPGLIHMDPKHGVLVNDRLKVTNGIHDIDTDKPLIVVVYNFSNVPPKITKHIMLGYTTRSPKLLLPVDSHFVAHISEAIG